MTTKSSEKPQLITPTFVVAWLINFIQYLLFYLLITTIALYAVKEFSASEAASGLAASSFVIGATIARIFSGYLTDLLGQRPILLTAVAVVAVASALYFPTNSLPLLIAVRTLHGFAYAFASTAIMAVVQTGMPSSRRAEGTGFFALSSTLATAVGPAAGLFLVDSYSHAVLFGVTLATSLVGLLLALFLRIPAKPSVGAQERFSLASIIHPSVLPIGLFMLLVGLSYSGVITYLNGYSVDRGLTMGAGLFFVAYSVVMLIMRFFLGRIQDVRGDNLVIALGLVSFCCALLLLAVASADWMVVMAGALTGMGYGTLMPACQAISVRLVEAHELGTGISTMFLLMDVGLGVGPVFLGMLVGAAGYGAMYVFLAAVLVVASALYVVVHGRHQDFRRQQIQP